MEKKKTAKKIIKKTIEQPAKGPKVPKVFRDMFESARDTSIEYLKTRGDITPTLTMLTSEKELMVVSIEDIYNKDKNIVMQFGKRIAHQFPDIVAFCVATEAWMVKSKDPQLLVKKEIRDLDNKVEILTVNTICNNGYSASYVGSIRRNIYFDIVGFGEDEFKDTNNKWMDIMGDEEVMTDQILMTIIHGYLEEIDNVLDDAITVPVL